MIRERKMLVQTVKLLIEPHFQTLKEPTSDREYHIARRAIQTYEHALFQLGAA